MLHPFKGYYLWFKREKSPIKVYPTSRQSLQVQNKYWILIPQGLSVPTGTGALGVLTEGGAQSHKGGQQLLGSPLPIAHFPFPISHLPLPISQWFWGAEGWLCWEKVLLGSAEGWWITCTRGTKGVFLTVTMRKLWLKLSGLPLPRQWGCWKCFSLLSILIPGPHSNSGWRNAHECCLKKVIFDEGWSGTFELLPGMLWLLPGPGEWAGCVQGHGVTFSALNLPPAPPQKKQSSVKYETEQQPRGLKACGKLQDPTSSPRRLWCSAQMTKEQHSTSKSKFSKAFSCTSWLLLFLSC